MPSDNCPVCGNSEYNAWGVVESDTNQVPSWAEKVCLKTTEGATIEVYWHYEL